MPGCGPSLYEKRLEVVFSSRVGNHEVVGHGASAHDTAGDGDLIRYGFVRPSRASTTPKPADSEGSIPVTGGTPSRVPHSAVFWARVLAQSIWDGGAAVPAQRERRT